MRAGRAASLATQRCKSGEAAMHLEQRCWDAASGRVLVPDGGSRLMLHAARRGREQTAHILAAAVVAAMRGRGGAEAAYSACSHMSKCKGMRWNCGVNAGPMSGR
jgi:hypothetical protein